MKMNVMHNNKTHRLIPGGAHTYSKGDDQFPSNAPRYLERGEGVHVWSDTGHRYLDWTMGLRSMSLGYGIKPVIDAAIEQIHKGSNFGRPSYIETQYAEELIEHLPFAEMVKYGKNGSNVTTGAVKLARAYTGRDYVALCKDHPFFSFDDWFIGATPITSGVPKAFSDLSLTFSYGKIDELERLFADYPNKIACVIMEAATGGHPPEGYLQQARDLCHKNGALFIIDEMITGFRWHAKGAQAYYNVDADLATFGKGIANGFALAVLVGKREYMDLGGLFHERERVFLMSTTHGAENHALAAARAVLQIYRTEDPTRQMWKIGQAIVDGLNELAKQNGIADQFQAGGVPCSPWFVCRDADRNVSMPFRTLFLQEMVQRGVLINYLAPSWSHRDEHVEQTLAAAAPSMKIYARALEDGVERYLKSEVIKPVFRKFN
jgi:glutamate-1-semialdehyde 2,1-aminomutase